MQTALPFVDALFKEYLLFRGFGETLQAFGAELRSDKVHGFQVDRVCALLFRRILPGLQCAQLMELLQDLDQHVYCRLDRASEEAVSRMEVALVRYFIVTALKARRPEKVTELFELYGELLLSGREGGVLWHAWFALPYVTKPEADPRFQVYFTPQWAALVETSFRNFLAQAFQQLPLPAVLRYDADRAKRAELQRSVEALRRENAELRARLGLPAAAAAAAAAAGGAAGASGTASGLMAAALAAELPAGRPGTPPGGSGEAAPGALQQGQPQPPRPSPYQQQLQQQPARVPSGPRLQLDALAGTESEELLLSHSSTVSMGSMEQHAPERQGLGRDGDGSSQEAGHARTVSLAHWADSAGGAEPSGAQPPLSDADWAAAVAATGASLPGEAREGSAAAAAAAATAQHGVLRPREVVAGGPGAPVTCCAFGPQGTHAASASWDGVVRIWAPNPLAGRGDAESSNGSSGGLGLTGAASVSASSTGSVGSSRQASFSAGGPVTRLAWDRRGDKLMLVGTRGRGFKAWHLDTQRFAFQVDAEADAPLVTDLACSPTEPTFVCATASDEGRHGAGRLSLWNLRAFKKAATFGLPSGAAVTAARFSPDGHQLAAAGIDGKVRIFDPASRNQVLAWPVADPGVPFAACFLGSSRLLATLSVDGYIKLWSTAVLRGPLAGLHVPLCSAAHAGVLVGGGVQPLGGAGPAGSSSTRRGGGGRLPPAAAAAAPPWRWRPDLACNQAGTAFAAASATREVPVVFVSGGEELRLETGAPGHGSAVPALDWHPDGHALLTGSADGSLILSNVRPRSEASGLVTQ